MIVVNQDAVGATNFIEESEHDIPEVNYTAVDLNQATNTLTVDPDESGYEFESGKVYKVVVDVDGFSVDVGTKIHFSDPDEVVTDVYSHYNNITDEYAFYALFEEDALQTRAEVHRTLLGATDVSPTSDYLDLSNKPQINGVTLTGNKTSSDLGLGADREFIAYVDNGGTLTVTYTNTTMATLKIGGGITVKKQTGSTLSTFKTIAKADLLSAAQTAGCTVDTTAGTIKDSLFAIAVKLDTKALVVTRNFDILSANYLILYAHYYNSFDAGLLYERLIWNTVDKTLSPFVRRSNVFAYFGNGGTVSIDASAITLPSNTLDIKCNGSTYEFTAAQVITAAQSAGMTVDSTNRKITHASTYVFYLDTTDGTIHFDKSTSTDKNASHIILFGKHYTSTYYGLLFDYMLSSDMITGYYSRYSDKARNIVAYIGNEGKFDYDNTKIRFGNSLVVRYANAASPYNYEFTIDQVLDVAEAAGLTVDRVNHTISNSGVFKLCFDVRNYSLMISKSEFITPPYLVVLYGRYYNSLYYGLLVDNYAKKEAHNNAPQVYDLVHGGVPSYYESHISEKIVTARTNMMSAGKHGETFVFITDLHWNHNNQHSPSLIRRCLEGLNINAVICGGDMISQGSKATMAKAMSECVRAFTFPNLFFPCAFGNHDTNRIAGNPQADWFDKNSDTYALMFKQCDGKVTYFGNNDYSFYFDMEATKTRFLICDTGLEASVYGSYPELMTTLLATPEGYSVIPIAHILKQSGVKTAFCTAIENIVDAFNAKGTVTVSGASYDFASLPNGANIPCVLGGHNHKDDDWETTGGIPFIVTDCDCGSATEQTDYPYISGTITEQAFDIVTVDYSGKTIKCVRVGRGDDRTYTFA